MPKRKAVPNSATQPELGCPEPEANCQAYDLDRLAALVANGQVPLPHDLDPDARNAVLVRVNRQRRNQLIDFLATVIAADIYRSSLNLEHHDHA